MKNILIIGLLVISNFIYAQKNNSIWLFDGKTKEAISYVFNEKEGFIDYVNEKGKNKSIDVEDVFKILKSNGESQYFYSEEIDGGNENSIKEMEDYILGEQFALQHKKSNGALLEGLLVGGGAGAAASVIGMPLAVLPFLTPFVNAPIVKSFGVSNNSIEKHIPEQCNNEIFIEGYQKATKKRRFNKSLVGGTIGFVSGLLTLILINGK